MNLVKMILGKNYKRGKTKGAFGGKQIKKVREMIHEEHVDECNRDAKERKKLKYHTHGTRFNIKKGRIEDVENYST